MRANSCLALVIIHFYFVNVTVSSTDELTFEVEDVALHVQKEFLVLSFDSDTLEAFRGKILWVVNINDIVISFTIFFGALDVTLIFKFSASSIVWCDFNFGRVHFLLALNERNSTFHLSVLEVSLFVGLQF